MLKKILKELVEIKRELQDIKLILKFQFLSNYKTESEIINGERFMTRSILPDPLEALRKEEDTLQERRAEGLDLVVHRQKLNRKNREAHDYVDV